MCIQTSVGKNAVNRKEDVSVVQTLLNMNQHLLAPFDLLEVDGLIGANTYNAIQRFQSRVLRMQQPDQVVDPHDRSIKLMQAGMNFTQSLVKGIMPLAVNANVDKYCVHLLRNMEQRNINNALRRAHFLAQIGHESASLRYSEEIASGEAYEGRADLGNNQTGDGQRFKGRGLIQLTGRANYQRYGDAINVDLVNDFNWQTVASDPERAVDVACWYWSEHNLNELADQDDVDTITRRINGGLNGFDDRKAYLERAKFFMQLA